jgi:hypothetical protein
MFDYHREFDALAAERAWRRAAMHARFVQSDDKDAFVFNHGDILLNPHVSTQAWNLVRAWGAQRQFEFFVDNPQRFDVPEMGAWPHEMQLEFYRRVPSLYDTQGKVNEMVACTFARIRNSVHSKKPYQALFRRALVKMLSGYVCPLGGEEGDILVTMGMGVYNRFYGTSNRVDSSVFEEIMLLVLAAAQDERF